MSRIALVVLVLAACGGDDDGPAIDAAPSDVPAVVRKTVFITFDGLTLTAGPDNATTNHSQLITGTQTMTPFADDHPAERDAAISQVTQSMMTVLQPFAVDVVTTRPTFGQYTMIVFGGAATEVGIGANLGGLATSACNGGPASPVILMFGDNFGSIAPGALIASSAVAGLGVSHGVLSSDKRDDCMCWTGANCGPTDLCTFGGPATPAATNDPCAMGRTTMDPRTEFEVRFGLAP